MAVLSIVAAPLQAAEGTPSQQSLEELRNTVVNILQALVAKGVITREQAEELVKQAQEKAAGQIEAQAARKAEEAKDDANAVRVPYVPQIVKDEIGKQVAAEVKPQVVASVVEQAKQQRWGVPAALPDWLAHVRVYGDITLRAQADIYPKDALQQSLGNQHSVFDFNAINQAGGFLKAAAPYLNITENRDRLRLRARLGLDVKMSSRLTAGIRLASGSLADPGSESQTLGTYSARYTVGIDQAFLRWNSSPDGLVSAVSATGGRFGNPWFAPTELVFARDLQFEGLASTVRWRFGDAAADRSSLFATAGGFPILEVPLVNKENKWLVGAQLGANLRWADGHAHLSAALGYYDFLHVTGVRNAPDSALTNYTAPAFIRYGNTLFDISNSTTDQTLNLFALAARFRLLDASLSYEQRFNRYSAGLVAEAVRNLGYNAGSIASLTGQAPPTKEDTGYVAEVSFGDPQVLQAYRWRARLGYRYVKRDAVIDAWTDTDFHGGGTNAAGYYLWGEVGVADNTWFRVRYLSANEIDGPRYGLDIVQVDLNARF
jgi:polyhydroxyalkanoate synthesis regulator phasin